MKGEKYRFSFSVTFIVIMIFVWGMISSVPFALGEEEKKDLPPRAISIAPAYPGVVVPQGDDVSIDLKVTNGGRQDENIYVALTSIPKGWNARIKTYSFE